MFKPITEQNRVTHLLQNQNIVSLSSFQAPPPAVDLQHLYSEVQSHLYHLGFLDIINQFERLLRFNNPSERFRRRKVSQLFFR